MKRRYLVVAFAAALLAAAGMVASPGPRGDPAPSRDTGTAGTTGEPKNSRRAVVARPVPARSSGLPDLPPSGMAFAEAVPDLRKLADAGHAEAACRLGVDLVLCRFAAEAQRWTPSVLESSASMERAGHSEAANALDERHLRLLEHAAACRELPEALIADGDRYLAAAARAGNGYAMSVYASGSHLHWERGFAATPEFDAWRRDAADMVHRALAAGRPEAVGLLMMAYRFDTGLLNAMVPDDPERAYAYGLLAANLAGSAPSGFLGRDLDAAATRRGARLAERLHREHFGSARLVDPSTVHALQGPPPAGSTAASCAPARPTDLTVIPPPAP